MGFRESLAAHPPEETIEQYALGKLSGDSLDQFEDHLLICPDCQYKVEQADQFIAAMRVAASKLEREQPVCAPKPARRNRLGWFSLFPKSALAGALAVAALAVVVWIPRPTPAAPEAEITLQAMRGGESGAVAAPAGKPFLLKVETGADATTASLRLAVVDPSGAELWSAPAESRAGLYAAVMSRKLNAGHYWVRLLDTHGDPVREYSLLVR